MMGECTMNSNYDVIVVGAGPAGIFTCYELTLKLPEATILLIDKGHDIYRRNCPILQKKLKNVRLRLAKKSLLAVCLLVLSQMVSVEPAHIQTGSLISPVNLEAG